MAARELVTRESAMMVLYGHIAAQPDPKIIDVWLCKLRRKLARQGIEIVTHWGVGWSLAQKSARAA
jgi:two-component system cell cycle response regulator CtrA